MLLKGKLRPVSTKKSRLVGQRCWTFNLFHFPKSYLFWFQDLIVYRDVFTIFYFLYFFVVLLVSCSPFIRFWLYFAVWLHLFTLLSQNRVSFGLSYLFFLVSLFADVKGIVEALVSGGLEVSSWSSKTISLLISSSIIISLVPSEHNWSVCFRFELGYFVYWWRSVGDWPSLLVI